MRTYSIECFLKNYHQKQLKVNNKNPALILKDGHQKLIIWHFYIQIYKPNMPLSKTTARLREVIRA